MQEYTSEITFYITLRVFFVLFYCTSSSVIIRFISLSTIFIVWYLNNVMTYMMKDLKVETNTELLLLHFIAIPLQYPSRLEGPTCSV